LNGWTPGFIVWPTTDAHVQAAVLFALAHSLCIMVAGTGHDFLNRHSCEDGIFIRMTLMKDISFDLTDSNGFGWGMFNLVQAIHSVSVITLLLHKIVSSHQVGLQLLASLGGPLEEDTAHSLLLKDLGLTTFFKLTL
jgi:hypothetical protein